MLKYAQINNLPEPDEVDLDTLEEVLKHSARIGILDDTPWKRCLQEDLVALFSRSYRKRDRVTTWVTKRLSRWKDSRCFRRFAKVNLTRVVHSRNTYVEAVPPRRHRRRNPPQRAGIPPLTQPEALVVGHCRPGGPRDRAQQRLHVRPLHRRQHHRAVRHHLAIYARLCGRHGADGVGLD